MADRRLKVTKVEGDIYTLKGVAYEADVPNINGTIYPRSVLEKALAEYLEKPEDERLLTIGCQVEPKLRDAIGVVTGGEMVGSEVRLEARTLATSSAAAAVAAAYKDALAFAGAGISEPREDEGTMQKFEITNMGVVRLHEVQPCEHKNQTKKRYPNPAKCKDCGASICPDCDGTKVGAWDKCVTCKGTGVLEENSDG
jgi:hypothetical protein